MKAYFREGKDYIVGRSDKCDIIVTPVICSKWKNVSKVHFSIKKMRVPGCDTWCFIEDHSSNGTFINRLKIGNGCIANSCLQNGDIISLCLFDNNVFQYKM